MTRPLSSRPDAYTPPAPIERPMVIPTSTATGEHKAHQDRLLARSFGRPHTPAVAGQPDMTPVRSSNIAAVGHDGSALWVQFNNGRMYRYPSAGREHHEAMLAAPSPGSYFTDKVRFVHTGERIG